MASQLELLELLCESVACLYKDSLRSLQVEKRVPGVQESAAMPGPRGTTAPALAALRL